MGRIERPSEIVSAFSRIAAARPLHPLFISSTQHASVGDIDRLSQSLADRIAASHLDAATLVGLSAPNGPAFIAGLLALRRTGHAALLLDPSAPGVDRERATTSVGASGHLGCSTGWPSSVDDFSIAAVDQSDRIAALNDVAVVKMTSGSTGAPRGVEMREEHLLSDESALARSMGFRADDRLLSTLPLSHSYGFTTLALSAMVRGLTLVMPADHSPFSPLLAAQELNATIFPTVPAYLQALLKMSQPPPWPDSIRLVISAGAVLPPHIATRFREMFGQPVHVFYGSSECGGICYDREGGAAERGTVGTPIEGVDVSFTTMLTADDQGGLVTVASSAVGVTYVPAADRRLCDGRFETMDLAEWQDGELALKGRVDHVINLRGRKVDPSEVEQVIAALEGVDEAVVLGIAAPDGGLIMRAVVASTAGALTYGSVAAWCRDRLAEHKIPRSIILVDAIPRTSRGKIDRPALLRLTSAPDAGVTRG